MGCCGDISKKNEDVFKTLLKLDTLRGKHSTGVASIGPKGDVIVRKVLGNPWDFDDSRSAQDVFTGHRNVLIGHNRYATKGAINKHNAHPFEFDRVVGVHNGTLRNQYDLLDYRDFDVDSENAYHSMNEIGERQTLEKIEGAYTFVWWNKEEQVLRMARNRERPMFYAYTTDERSMFFASEAWMLTVACSRGNVAIHPIQEVAECEIYDFAVPLQYASGKELMPDPTSQPFQEYYRPITTTTTYNRGYTGYNSNTNNRNTTKNNVSQMRGKPEGEADKDNPLSKPTIDEVVEFEVLGSVRTKGNCYIEAKMTQYEEENVRIYAPEKGELWKSLLEDDSGLFSGKIKRTKKDGDVVVWLIALNSVTPADALDEILQHVGSKTKYPIYMGAATAEIWEEQVAEGCAICADVADRREAHKYVWAAPKTYFCEGCKDTPFAKEYMETT